MELIIANPRGFCAGVQRAIDVVDDLLEFATEPVFVRHAIVHNHDVVARLKAKGAHFVEELEQVPDGAILVFSAHGVSPTVTKAARNRDLRLIDATCPLVTRVQLEVVRQSAAGRSVIIVGHRGHVEVEGLAGHFGGPGVLRVVENENEAALVEVPDPEAVAYVTQTTLAVSQANRVIGRLRERFPNLAEPRGDTICYATQNRQQAVRYLANETDVIFVIGSSHSSNSNRMAEVAREQGCEAFLIDSVDDISRDSLRGVLSIGLSAGASAPERLVQEVIATLSAWFPGIEVRHHGEPENLHFKAPARLLALKKDMEMEEKQTADSGTVRMDGLNDVIDAAVDLAQQLRDSSITVARLAEREVAMVVTVAEDSRDRVLSAKFLDEAREMEVLKSLRASLHKGGDLAFDAVSIALKVGLDAANQFLSTPRRKDASVNAA